MANLTNKFGQVKSNLMQPSALILIVAIIVAVFFGIFATAYVDFAYERLGILLALPGVLLLGFLFLFDRYTLFLLIILTRSMLDPLFDQTKLGGVGVGGALNALVIVIAVIALIQNSQPFRKLLRTTWLPYLLVLTIATAIAPDKVSGIKSYLTQISYAAVFVLGMVLVKTHQDFGKWMKAVILSSIVPVLYGAYSLVSGAGHGAEGIRIKSTFAHFNIFAFYLVTVITISFYLIKSPTPYLSANWRRILFLYLGPLAFMLLMTKTRSAWVGCFAFFALYGLIFERKYLAMVFMGMIVAMFIPEIRDRITSLTENNEVYTYSTLNSFAWRKYIWESGFNWMEPSHYFFGYGTEAFVNYSIDFFPLAGGRKWGAHSVYVQLFFETGIFGLLAFIYMMIRSAKYLIPFYHQNKLLVFTSVLLIVEFATYCYSDNMLQYLNFNWYFWFAIGAVYSLLYHERKQQEAELIVTPVPEKRR